jgi:ubiquinone biosynthesis protein UbiJ
VNPLEAALRPLASVLNRNIRATTPARELCEKLAGTIVAVRVRDTALVTWFIVHKEHLEIVTDTEDEPDILVSGSLLSLARMAGVPGANAIRDGSLEFTGDPILAQEFQQLLTYARPDLEEELSGVVGDVAAHRIGEIARGVGKWGLEASATMGNGALRQAPPWAPIFANTCRRKVATYQAVTRWIVSQPTSARCAMTSIAWKHA